MLVLGVFLGGVLRLKLENAKYGKSRPRITLTRLFFTSMSWLNTSLRSNEVGMWKWNTRFDGVCNRYGDSGIECAGGIVAVGDSDIGDSNGWSEE